MRRSQPVSWARALPFLFFALALAAVSVMSAPAADARPAQVPAPVYQLNLDDGPDPDAYSAMVMAIRGVLPVGFVDQAERIRHTAQGSTAVFTVELRIDSRSVQLVFRASNLYVLGWYDPVSSTFYHFSDVDAGVLPDAAKAVRLGFTSSYTGTNSLNSDPNDRLDGSLTYYSTLIAVSHLTNYTGNTNSARQAFVTLVQITSEAARFNPMLDRVRDDWLGVTTPQEQRALTVGLENSWSDLSTLAYNANNGTAREVTIIPPSPGEPVKVRSQSQAAPFLAVALGQNCLQVKARQETTKAAAPGCEPSSAGLFVVKTRQVRFFQPGDAGGQTVDPYGWIGVAPTSTGPFENTKLWEQGDSDVPRIYSFNSTANFVFYDDDGIFCFNGQINEHDGRGNDDDVLHDRHDAAACASGASGDKLTLKGTDGSLQIDFTVSRLVEPCRVWLDDGQAPCANGARNHIYIVDGINFTNPGDAGDGPEPYGSIHMIIDDIRLGDDTWYEPNDSNPPTVNFAAGPNPVIYLAYDARPCMNFDVKERDGSGNADDILAKGSACATATEPNRIRRGEGDGDVTVDFRVYEVGPSLPTL
ncbi:ribosome-inactivating family protein [Streptomyces liangshanensis]|uniref:ribosome-inactivating family protein n=1 Tax=Streptomyces liangshanensis TaxID=2717324 RepID=UPI0036D82F60